MTKEASLQKELNSRLLEKGLDEFIAGCKKGLTNREYSRFELWYDEDLSDTTLMNMVEVAMQKAYKQKSDEDIINLN